VKQGRNGLIPSFRGAREREPGIQMLARCLFLDSGSPLMAASGMTSIAQRRTITFAPIFARS